MRTAISITLAAAAIWAQEVRIAPGPGTKVEAIVQKTGLLSGRKHILAWERFTGRFSPTHVELTVEAASLRVLDDWINEGKKEDVRREALGKNVLDVAKFPTIAFVSTGVSGDTATAFEVSGNLTVRGITKPVTLAIERTADGYKGETSFSMSAFRIKPPKALLGAIGTKDEMTIRFAVVSTL